MIPADIDSISDAHIDALVANSVSEGRTIEFKQTLPGGRDADKKEFLADVSSFANASGGDIIYGIAQKNGQADQIVGLSSFDKDKELLRLEEVIRNGIQPRIQGLRTRVVENLPAGPVLVIRVQRSWSGPHMVTFKNTSRFYARNSAGKFQLDVDELRSAFALAGSIPERIRAWRDDRIAKVIAEETPVRLEESGKMILHIVPVDTVDDSHRIGGAELLKCKESSDFRPMAVSQWGRRINLDGVVTHGSRGTPQHEGFNSSYCQLFRSGRLEAVCGYLGSFPDGTRALDGTWYEAEVLKSSAEYIRSLFALNVIPPVIVMLSMVNVRGMELIIPSRSGADNHPIDRDVLILPDVVLEEPPQNLPKLMRPIFDAVWNAGGVSQSLNFDENDNWNQRHLKDVP